MRNTIYLIKELVIISMSMWNTLTIKYNNSQKADDAYNKLVELDRIHTVKKQDDLVYVNFWNTNNIPKSLVSEVNDGLEKFVIAKFEDFSDSGQASVYSSDFEKIREYFGSEGESGEDIINEIEDHHDIKITKNFS